jgi:transcriptional regulator with XRE-family HTH domain
LLYKHLPRRLDISSNINELLNRELLSREFGILLAGERRRKHFSQAQFAARVGLSRTSVTNIERGRQAIQLHHLYTFASALQIEVTKLLPKESVVSEPQVAATEDKRDRYLAEAMKALERRSVRVPEAGRAR